MSTSVEARPSLPSRTSLVVVGVSLMAIGLLGFWPAMLGAAVGGAGPALALRRLYEPRIESIRTRTIALFVLAVLGSALAERVIRGPVSFANLLFAMFIGFAIASLLCAIAGYFVLAQLLRQTGQSRG